MRGNKLSFYSSWHCWQSCRYGEKLHEKIKCKKRRWEMETACPLNLDIALSRSCKIKARNNWGEKKNWEDNKVRICWILTSPPLRSRGGNRINAIRNRGNRINAILFRNTKYYEKLIDVLWRTWGGNKARVFVESWRRLCCRDGISKEKNHKKWGGKDTAHLFNLDIAGAFAIMLAKGSF